jgi:hypothetical protein
MESLFVDSAAWIILGLVGLAVYDTYKWWRWANFYQSKTISYLFRSAVVKTVTALPLGFLAAYRIIGGATAPPFPFGGYILIIAVILLIANLTITTLAFRELDSPLKTGSTEDPDDYEQIVNETKNQREDRHFGQKRRALEAEHHNEDK